MEQKKTRVSLLDVARQAGVSSATVSRVINNSAPVSAVVRARVVEAAATLGYEVPASRVTSANATRTAAVLITDILNPFFPALIQGINREARSAGIGMLLYDTSEDPVIEQQVLKALAERDLDGVIVCGSRISNEELINFSNRYKVPLVVINRNLHCAEIPCVRIDFEKAVYHAARHLLSLGHTRIAYLAGPSNTEVSIARKQGLEKALNEAGLEFRSEWLTNSFPNVAGGFQAMSSLLTLPESERPTAVQAYNDLMALGAMQAIRAHQLRVPQDISVIGFDDIALAAHAHPPLTTIEQPKVAMGSLAMKILRELMDEHSLLSGGYTVLEARLVVRDSTGPARRL